MRREFSEEEQQARGDAKTAMRAEGLMRAVASTPHLREKPLPEMVSPMVRLDLSLRKHVAMYCREAGQSFSILTEQMWVDKLKKEGCLRETFELPAKMSYGRGGKTVAAYKEEIANLKARIAGVREGKH